MYINAILQQIFGFRMRATCSYKCSFKYRIEHSFRLQFFTLNFMYGMVLPLSSNRKTTFLCNCFTEQEFVANKKEYTHKHTHTYTENRKWATQRRQITKHRIVKTELKCTHQKRSHLPIYFPLNCVQFGSVCMCSLLIYFGTLAKWKCFKNGRKNRSGFQ